MDHKQEAIKQWSETPIGVGVTSYPAGTPEFFKAVENDRYEHYAPWMKEFFRFDRYRGKRVLEVGVGVGTDHVQFARSGAIMSGVDITPRSIELTRANLARFGFSSDLRVADAEALPFSDHTFDAVYSFGVLHHTPDTPHAVREVHRVLKPGGVAIIALYHRHSLVYWFNVRIWERIVHRRFLHETLPDTLSRVEYTQGQAKPLVQLFSIKEVRKMCAAFSVAEIAIRHLNIADLPIPKRWGLQRIGQWIIPPVVLTYLSRSMGWYVIARAQK